MKRLLLVIVTIVLLIGGISVPAFSDSEGVINVTAEVAQLSVSVSPNTVSYGLVPLNTEGVQPDGNPLIFAQNTGNCFTDLQIKGANTSNWTLAADNGPDEYVHYWGQGFPDVIYTAMTDEYGDLGAWDSYAPFSSEVFYLQMDTPTESSFFETQSTTVTVMVSYEEEGIRSPLEAYGPYASGSANVTVTANVTDQDNSPVTGLTADNFFTLVFSGTLPDITLITEPALTADWTENGGGIYTGTISDISTLPGGDYWVAVNINDGSHLCAAGDSFVITE